MSGIDALIDHALHLLAPIAGIDPRWALLALAFQLGNLVCRAFAWRNVLAAAYPNERLQAYRVGLAYAVGVALNGYLPARGGEAAKIALVRLQMPSTSAVTVASSSTVVILFDSLVAVALLTIGWMSGALPAPPALPHPLMLAVHAPLVAGAIVLALAGIVALAVRIIGPKLRGAAAHIAQGLSVLRSPVRYARTVLSIQSLAWCCRIGVVYCLLAAFSIHAGLPLAALVVVVGGMSTLVPVPGGAGSQQALAVFVLSGVAAASTAFTFSVGMQVGITVVNTTIGAIAAMLAMGRLHPLAALRDAAAAASLRPVVDPLP
jgi:uncharacterized membrane protein YbhN (UPF0104 family)